MSWARETVTAPLDNLIPRDRIQIQKGNSTKKELETGEVGALKTEQMAQTQIQVSRILGE